MNQPIDDGLDWLRETRAKLAQQCDYNPYKLREYYDSLRASYQSNSLFLKESSKQGQCEKLHTSSSGTKI